MQRLIPADNGVKIMPIDLLSNLSGLPQAADPDAAARGLEGWRGYWESADEAAPPDELEPLLTAIFGNSPFLSSIIGREPPLLIEILNAGPKDHMATIIEAVAETGADPDLSTEALGRSLRVAKRAAALTVAVADIGGLWTTEQATEALSRFAEQTIDTACCHLMRRGAAKGDIEPKGGDDAARNGGLVVLGMGKLGSRELNYSSDIDLIVLYDADRVAYHGRRGIQDFFVKLAHQLVQLLDTHTAEGYVFRTDLRLRPDPGSTPSAMSVLAAETYYESLGQNWERLAMIKARPVAGDREAGEAFLAAITPFIWRRNLDFATLKDIQAIKRQINTQRGGDAITVPGHNIKLGRGGIREIEFYAQTQQLIWGGRFRELRERRTCAALAALTTENLIEPEVEAELVESYWHLRRLEHRLQMVDDQQTHTLPEDEAGLAAIATFTGDSSLESFSKTLADHLTRVANRYSDLFHEEDETDTDQGGDRLSGNLVFTGVEDDPETLKTLAAMGFERPELVSQTIRGWHHGRLRATRSTRTRQILTGIKGDLLRAFAATADPDAAFLRFHEFLGNLPAGVQLFSLFEADHRLLNLVAEIMGTAPRLASYLSRQAHLLDAVLTDGFFGTLPDKAELREALEHEMAVANDMQDCLDIARRWSGDVKFQVSVQAMRGMLDADAAGRVLSDVADLVCAFMLETVADEMSRRYGRIPGAEVALIGLGKLGSQSLMRGSDLDLVMVYHSPEPDAHSDGDRSLPPATYYSRLCQRLVTALSSQTGEGVLYEVDLRLRPMGKDGPVASDLATVATYYEKDAWTWELMALTRARVVVAPESLETRLNEIIHSALVKRRDPSRLVREVAEMREKIAAEHGTDQPWRVKHVRGGLIDVEFIAQYLQLRDAHDHPEVLDTHTGQAIQNLVAADRLDPERGQVLLDADKLYRGVQAMLRLCLADSLNEDTAPEGLRTVLARAGGTIDFAALKDKLLATQDQVRAVYAAEIAEPADQAQQAEQTG